MFLLVRWVLSAVSIMAVAYLVPGITVRTFGTALIVALALGLVNATVRPVLVLLTLPLTVLTLGLFIIVINALMLWFVGSIIKGFDVDGFGSALLGAVLVMAFSWLVNNFVHELRHSGEQGV